MTPPQLEIFFKRMVALGVPKVVLLLVLLVSFLDLPKIEEEYQVLEYFAGVGRVAALAKFCHYRSAALDIKYGEEGFLRAKKRSPMDINSDAGLVLAIHLILASEWEAAVGVLAVVCSSMVPVNRSSTARSLMTPLGNEDFLAVRRSNKLTSRSVLCMLLLVCAGSTYIMENPLNSLVALHPRYVWFVEALQAHGIFTYKIAFWMRKFGSMSFKRTWVWSCSKRICELDMGCLTPSEKNGSLQTTTRYVDKSGKRRFKGNALLKRSQQYTYKFASKLVQLVPKIRRDTMQNKVSIQEIKRQREQDHYRAVATPVRARETMTAAPDADTIPGDLDAGVGEVPSGPGSPELPLEDVHAELGDPSLVHEGDKSETEDSALVAALGGLSDDEDELGNHWVPCNDDPYASATMEIDEVYPSWGDFVASLAANEHQASKDPETPSPKPSTAATASDADGSPTVESSSPETPVTPAGSARKASTGESADMKRLRRLMQPRTDGTYLVPKEIVDKWMDVHGGGRDSVVNMWDVSGSNKESFIKRCRHKVESINEQDLFADGEYMSEKDMIDEKYDTARINAIKLECSKQKGWIRRDRYEKHVKLYFVEKKLGAKSLKRRRQTLEEDESMDEEEFGRLKSEADQNLMPDDFVLPEDLTDPNIIIEADGDEDAKKALKTLSFPTMDDDGLPSSYIQKVVAAIAKWRVKMHALVSVKDELEECPENMTQLFTKALDVDDNLKRQEEEIMAVNMQGIVDGFTREHQEKLTIYFKDGRKWCTCALNLNTRAAPFVSHIKGLARKRAREEMKENAPAPKAKAVKQEPRSRGR